MHSSPNFSEFPTHLREKTQNGNYIVWPVKKKKKTVDR